MQMHTETARHDNIQYSDSCLQSYEEEITNPVVVSICISFFWLERQRLTRSTKTSSLMAYKHKTETLGNNPTHNLHKGQK